MNFPEPNHSVYIVDGCREERVLAVHMLRSCGFEPRPFANEADLFESLSELRPGIIFFWLPVCPSKVLAFFARQRTRNVAWPVVILARQVEVADAVALMKAGAMDLLQVPFVSQDLWAAVESGLNVLGQRLEKEDRVRASQERVDTLSARETEVLRGLCAGLSNKEIGELLGLSVRTVEMHRSNLMDGLQVSSLAGALRVAWEAGLEAPSRRAA